MRRGRRCAAIPTAAILALAAASIAATSDARSKEASMSPAPEEANARRCVGRFCVDVPTEMQRRSESYEMQRVRLQELELSPPVEGALARTLQERLARIEALKLKRRTPTDPRGTILQKRTFQAGMLEGAVYQQYNNELAITVGALRQVGSAALWIEGGGDRKFTEEIAASVKDVGLAYHSRGRDEPWPVPGKDWFYLGQGAVALPFKEQEKASAGFEGHPLGVKFEVAIRTTAKPVRKGLMQRFSEAVMAAGPAFTGAGSPVKQRARTAGGLQGEEMIMRDSDAKRLYYLWDFPGEPNSGAHPRITLQMETRDERFEEKTALWDRLVDSLRPAAR